MKRIAPWLAVLCLWTAVAAVWPGSAFAEVPPEFKATQELRIPQDEVPAEPRKTAESALRDGAFTTGSVDTDGPETGGFRSWWQKQGWTLAKGFAAGLIGAGIVAIGALLLGAGAPVILAGAAFAALGGAIYGATVDPGSFSWGQAIGVSVFSGASAAVGTGGWLPAVGRTAGTVGGVGRAAAGIRGLFGIGRGIAASAPRQTAQRGARLANGVEVPQAARAVQEFQEDRGTPVFVAILENGSGVLLRTANNAPVRNASDVAAAVGNVPGTIVDVVRHKR